MRFVIINILLLIFSAQVSAAWDDLLDFFKSEDSGSNALTSLSQDEVISGLKQALQTGSRYAVDYLGKEDGFMGRPQFRIPLPEKLHTAESALRKLGQDEIADEFILSMNRAAEQAVPAAGEILVNIISNMSVKDAYGILQGSDDAATTYLRDKGGKKLTKRFLPIVEQATDSVGVTKYYNSFIDKLGMMSSLVDTEALDIDEYVTNQAIDSLFQLVAEQEKLIRDDPAARTTDLLKKVFSSN